MRQPPAEQQAGLGTLLANGLVRVASQSPLSKVQWLLLALFVACATILGLALQPRQQDPAARDAQPVRAAVTEAPAAASDAAPAGAAAGATADATADALDKLAREVARINQKLDEVVAGEKQSALRLSSLEEAGKASRTERPRADRDAVDAERDGEATRKGTDRPASRHPRERGALTVHRQARAASAARRRAAKLLLGSQPPPGPPVLARRLRVRQGILRERRRRLAGARPVFGFLPHL